jgi:hypothetical protein
LQKHRSFILKPNSRKYKYENIKRKNPLIIIKLQSANVFLTKDGTAKLGDMNVSKVAKKGLLYT